jgi:phosphate transport system substrate-binding protein
MIHRHIMRSARIQIAAASFVLAVAGVAHAATPPTLVGGGSTLPSIGYVGINAVVNMQLFGSSGGNSVASNSLFGVYMAQSASAGVSYCITGSGAGKDILAGAVLDGFQYNVQNACVKDSSDIVTGFGAQLVGVNRPDLTQPNFTASDLPLTAYDYINYESTHLNASDTDVTGYPIQFPAVAGAIAIVFNLTDTLGNRVTASEVNFSNAQLCGIFSGDIYMWDDPALASAFTLPAGHSIPYEPINLQYRSDSNGTTFGLSNYLANVCGSVFGYYFEASQTFSSAVANFSNDDQLPSNWTGSSGDAAVTESVVSTPDSIGYVEMANALATSPQLPIADVNGTSPVSDFGSPFTIPPADVVYNEVISSSNNANGTAALQAINSLSGVISPPSTRCIALIQPADYAGPGVKATIVPAGTYPIMAISYLLANTDGNGTDLSTTQGLLTSPYNSAITSQVSTIGPGTGLAFLNFSGPSHFAITASQISSCLVN